MRGASSVAVECSTFGHFSTLSSIHFLLSRLETPVYKNMVLGMPGWSILDVSGGFSDESRHMRDAFRSSTDLNAQAHAHDMTRPLSGGMHPRTKSSDNLSTTRFTSSTRSRALIPSTEVRVSFQSYKLAIVLDLTEAAYTVSNDGQLPMVNVLHAFKTNLVALHTMLVSRSAKGEPDRLFLSVLMCRQDLDETSSLWLGTLRASSDVEELYEATCLRLIQVEDRVVLRARILSVP